jgi:thymidylate synthase (FAD)
MKATLIDHMGDDLMVVNAARVSFNKMSEWKEGNSIFYTPEVLKEEDERLIKYLAAHGHWTPFAHPHVTLHIKAPIFIRTQCFKHKVGFVENEVSRRYVSDEPEFFYPSEFRGKPTNAKQGSDGPLDGQTQQKAFVAFDWLYAQALREYKHLLDIGVAPEQARAVLPQGAYTEWYWTGSLAAWARFCKQRLDPHAQSEIQDLAKQVSEIITPLFPVSWRHLCT